MNRTIRATGAGNGDGEQRRLGPADDWAKGLRMQSRSVANHAEPGGGAPGEARSVI